MSATINSDCPPHRFTNAFCEVGINYLCTYGDKDLSVPILFKTQPPSPANERRGSILERQALVSNLDPDDDLHSMFLLGACTRCRHSAAILWRHSAANRATIAPFHYLLILLSLSPRMRMIEAELPFPPHAFMHCMVSNPQLAMLYLRPSGSFVNYVCNINITQ